eukprot:TRINITY_DN14145_c0_g1_i1.p1 TRINITY_DN14145_c0_g1~~TRINITY_DN14145_c0_g1_i1.p1  ORF type:complete len:197 (+),score=27.31 TRINITY_DN14145_c0_g1_i1:574-1164(+)
MENWCEEWPPENIGIPQPPCYPCKTLEDCLRLAAQVQTEGFVVQQQAGNGQVNRIKVKTIVYIRKNYGIDRFDPEKKEEPLKILLDLLRTKEREEFEHCLSQAQLCNLQAVSSALHRFCELWVSRWKSGSEKLLVADPTSLSAADRPMARFHGKLAEALRNNGTLLPKMVYNVLIGQTSKTVLYIVPALALLPLER